MQPLNSSAGCYALLLMLSVAAGFAQPVPVQLRAAADASANGQFELLRDGKPYFIQGAGGQDSLPLLVECGGNSIRAK